MAKRVLKACGLLLMAAILVLNLSTMFLNGLGLGEQLNWLPGALLTVESGSMEPILSEGDLLLIWETPYEELQVGDIITFHGNNELVTHRIIRQEGDLFVPKGTANNIEDAPIGKTEYCAKVIGTIPRGGIVLDLMTSPMGLALLVLFVLASFFGVPVLNRILAKAEQEEAKPMRLGMSRILAAGTVVSMCCVVPFVTAAKYTADINEYGFTSAGATYFSSNYLTAAGKSHSVKGWNGAGYGLTLEMRNYENDLLCSENNINYYLRVEIDDSEEFSTDYTVEIDSTYTATADTAFEKHFVLSGSGSSQGPKWTRFQIGVVPLSEGALQPPEKIRFHIKAATEGSTDFEHVLIGTFTFEVAASDSFLDEWGMETTSGSALVTYNIKTRPAAGVTNKQIQVTWPSDLMYINEYESTVANIIAHSPENFNRGSTTPGSEGSLIMSLPAYSNVTLQFFKYDPFTEVDDDTIVCKEID